jgi:membrane-bound lytic murein transglycosylase F
MLLFGILLLGGCQPIITEANLQRIIDRGYVKVGTLYGPTSYYIGAQGPAGYEYELAKNYADYLGVELKIMPSYNLKSLFDRVENSEVDFLAAGLTVTANRLEQYNFAPSYHQVSQKLVFKQGNEWPRQLKDLSGILMVTASSSHVENLQKLQKIHPKLEWQETSELDNEELLLKVLAGEIDYTISDSNTLAVNRRYYPEVSIAFTIQNDEPLAWLVSKNIDDSILASLIEFFGQAHHDGTIKALD